jgi:hypothetical protein
MFRSRSGIFFYFRKFKLGHIYACSGDIVKFIQVTPKGFNLLNLKTNKCILKHHLYSPTWSRKEIPDDERTFLVCVPDHVTLKETIDIRVK